MINDQVIIDNTHFRLEDDALICYTNLPDGSRFEQVVSSQEAVQKNMIGWCNTVREYIAALAAEKEEERVSAKRVRQKSPAPEATPDTPVAESSTEDPRAAVLEWYTTTQTRIDELSEQIAECKLERTGLRNERDRIKPVIDAWKGVRGEESN